MGRSLTTQGPILGAGRADGMSLLTGRGGRGSARPAAEAAAATRLMVDALSDVDPYSPPPRKTRNYPGHGTATSTGEKIE